MFAQQWYRVLISAFVPAHTSVVAMAAMYGCVFELVQHPPYPPVTGSCSASDNNDVGNVLDSREKDYVRKINDWNAFGLYFYMLGHILYNYDFSDGSG